MFRQSEHPETQHNYRRKVNELFRAAMRKKWCKETPVQDAAKPNRIAPTPEVFTVDELVRVLEHADEYGLMPYIVLGTFCGIRVSELEQLDWSKVSLTDRAVTIEATTAKTKTRRVITLNDTAVAWLTPHVKKSGPVVEVEGLRERLLQLREAAKLTKWPHNAMRHSFGSYAVRQWNDLPKVSYEMGNSVQVCRRHYEQVVTKSEAERFWSLRPSEAKNIIPMPKVANA
jgi:integrase